MQLDDAWIARWVSAINDDPACANTGRGFDGSFTLAASNHRWTFHVRDGRVERCITDGGPLEPSAFTLSAADDVWADLFAPEPPPMGHAIFAAVATGKMSFEGDMRLLFQQMATLSHWVLAARALNGPTPLPADPEWHEHWQATGRYVNVTVDGCRHKVFYFEAGEGIPLLCQHTAGNENRQWRHLLEDRELTKHYRVIAYDLPSHGKSDPPYDRDFFTEDHLLTADWVTRFVVALADALKLDHPVFIGCSIGGVIAAHLAERFPERFRGLVGLAGAVPTYGFFHDWWIDPAVNVNQMVAGLMDAVTAPGLSRADRQMNRMMQSAHPRALRNDLYFWGVENADPERPARIDASKVPLYLYAGQYDFTCPPEHVEASARAIGGVHYEMLEGLGHFPMSEDYARFRPVLLRTLADIEKRRAG
jgi:pimeloyl-ACP methyl ester carboxylesterase/putative sterol carrier protein